MDGLAVSYQLSPVSRQIVLLLLIFVLAGCSGTGRDAARWIELEQLKEGSGRVIRVSDGDTITVLLNEKPIKIRLYGVDCPERGQDFGTKAKQFTSRMAFGKQARIDPVEEDRYGRVVAWVWFEDINLNRELVRAGLAWHYRRYAPTAFDLFRLETEAKAKGIGLWSLAKPIPPWEFRRAS